MREIKFRAWRKKLGGMFYLDKHGLMENSTDQISLMNFMEQADEMGDVLGLEWMQYTGLKDKNGKESYWDDIVSDGINPPFVITPDYHLLARLSEIEFEVIGNIYENPELLGGENGSK